LTKYKTTETSINFFKLSIYIHIETCQVLLTTHLKRAEITAGTQNK